MDHRQSKNIASSASLATCSKPKQVHDQPYTYQPISSDHAIRVATIQLGEYGSPLTITLREVELPRKGNGWAVPEYQTLSYEWGQDGRDRPIYCDGRILLITRNLEAALQRLRSTDEPLLIWMDSICIDQDNVAERSHQVSMMALIYKSSPRVNMWLGEENETTQEGISMLESLDKLYDQLKKRLKSRRSSESWLEDDIMSINYLRSILGDEAGIENEKPERWDALRDIMSRSYFERTWIAQEVLLSWKRHGNHWNPSLPMASPPQRSAHNPKMFLPSNR